MSVTYIFDTDVSIGVFTKDAEIPAFTPYKASKEDAVTFSYHNKKVYAFLRCESISIPNCSYSNWVSQEIAPNLYFVHQYMQTIYFCEGVVLRDMPPESWLTRVEKVTTSFPSLAVISCKITAKTREEIEKLFNEKVTEKLVQVQKILEEINSLRVEACIP